MGFVHMHMYSGAYVCVGGRACAIGKKESSLSLKE